MIEAISITANALAVVGWMVNIRYRKQAMWIFTVATVLSLYYFAVTHQTPFVWRFVFYLGIDVVTLWQIARDERKQRQSAAERMTG